MKIFKILKASIGFSTKFLINSQVLGVQPPNPDKCIFLNFSKFLPKFSRNPRENLKYFWKLGKFSLKIIKELQIFPKTR